MIDTDTAKGVQAMKKINSTVWRETKYIALWVLLLSVLMQSVFLIIGRWDVSVLLGNLLSAVLDIGNFFLLGLTVQSAVDKEEKEAKSLMKLSQSLRMILIFAGLAVGVALPIFHTWACLIPIVFVRVALLFRPLFGGMQDDTSAADGDKEKKDKKDEGNGASSLGEGERMDDHVEP